MASNNGVVKCEKPTNKQFKDCTGQQYRRLTVVEYYGKQARVYKSGKRAGQTKHDHYWLCQCECGECRVVAGNSLTSGNTTSCGCYDRERKTTHGLKDHPSYRRYLSMVSRCTNLSCKDYANYGGRGITIYPAWLIKKDDIGLKKYLWFIDNILGPCPGPEYTVERKDNDRGYYPWNLEWADKSEQSRNRRNVRLTRDDALMIKFGNLPGTTRELGEQFGVSKSMIGKVRTGKRWAELTQADYDARFPMGATPS